jgi:hypothetical protein
MPYKQNKEHNLKEEFEKALGTEIDFTCKYIISPHHRMKGKRDKTIWTLSHDGEVECFIFSYSSEWFEGNICYGLVIENNTPVVVGENPSGGKLKLAKFIDSSNTSLWHGYPADYLERAQDRPNESILRSWVNKKYITKAKMLKIRSGKPCNL